MPAIDTSFSAVTSTDDLLRAVSEFFASIAAALGTFVNTINPAHIIAAIVHFLTDIASVVGNIDIVALTEYVRVHAIELAIVIREFIVVHVLPVIIALRHSEHPYILGVGLIFILEPTLVLAPTFVILSLISLAAGGILALALCTLGFVSYGIRAGSIAAGLQSLAYGAAVPADSFFALAQSAGTQGITVGMRCVLCVPLCVSVPTTFEPITTCIMWVIRLSCGAAGVYVLGAHWNMW